MNKKKTQEFPKGFRWLIIAIIFEMRDFHNVLVKNRISDEFIIWIQSKIMSKTYVLLLLRS